MRRVIIEISGNVGVGKSYTINGLYNICHGQLPVEQEHNIEVLIREGGAMEYAVETNSQFKKKDDILYILLDASVEKCLSNICKRGESLIFYDKDIMNADREKFLTIANENNILVIDVEHTSIVVIMEQINQLVQNSLYLWNF